MGWLVPRHHLGDAYLTLIRHQALEQGKKGAVTAPMRS